jgi:hypothetical protein
LIFDNMNSQDPTKTGEAPATKADAKMITWFTDCVVLAGDHPDAPIVAAGGPAANLSKIRAQLVSHNTAHSIPERRIVLSFPLPDKQKANEEAGFGVRYASKFTTCCQFTAPAWPDSLTNRVFTVDAGQRTGSYVAQTDSHRLGVNFPLGQFTYTVEEPTPAIATRFHCGRAICTLSVRLTGDARPVVQGFGLPFANPEDSEVDGWVNRNTPIVPGLTLSGFLRQTEFFLVVFAPKQSVSRKWDARDLPPPFSYPYGTQHRKSPKPSVMLAESLTLLLRLAKA